MQVWIVGKNIAEAQESWYYEDPAEPRPDGGKEIAWDFFGVFSSEELARAACTGPLFFCAPYTLDVRCADARTLNPDAVIPVEFTP